MRSNREKFSYIDEKLAATEHCSNAKLDKAELCAVSNSTSV